MKNSLAFASILAAFIFAAAPALADVAPPQSCTTVGAACNNAGDAYNEPGTCQATTCQKLNPTDGGTYEYACNLCIAGASDGGGGTSATGGTSSTGGSSAGTGGKKSESSDSGGGCSIGGAGQRTGLFVGLGLLAIGALAFGRKKS